MTMTIRETHRNQEKSFIRENEMMTMMTKISNSKEIKKKRTIQKITDSQQKQKLKNMLNPIFLYHLSMPI